MNAARSASSSSSASHEPSDRRYSMMQPRLRPIRPRTAPIVSEEPRRRALSEAVPSLGHGRWRIVGAWSSRRKGSNSDDSTERKEKDKSSYKDQEHTEKQTSLRPRKRVSLFLRRRRKKSSNDEEDNGRKYHLPFGSNSSLDKLKYDQDNRVEEEEEEDDDEEQPQQHYFQRAQSHLIKPVGEVTAHGHGEAARYLQYAADIDDDSFDRLKELALQGRNGNAVALVVDDEETTDGNSQKNEQGEEEFIGEICLEDFADENEEFDFLDNQSVDFGFEPTSGGRISRRPSLKLDSNKVRWIGNEKEFAAFFADIGLDDWFDVETEAEWGEFEVGEGVEKEWREAGIEHNQRCIEWKEISNTVDIRDLANEFSQEHDVHVK